MRAWRRLPIFELASLGLRRGPVGVDVGDYDSRLARAVDLGGRRERHALLGHRVLQGGA